MSHSSPSDSSPFLISINVCFAKNIFLYPNDFSHTSSSSRFGLKCQDFYQNGEHIKIRTTGVQIQTQCQRLLLIFENNILRSSLFI